MTTYPRGFRRGAAAALLTLVLTLAGATGSAVRAQQQFPPCMEADDLAQSVIARKRPGPDGKTTIIYKIPNSTDPLARTAFLNAVNDWNGKSARSGITYRAVRPGETPDIQLRYTTNNEDLDGGCAAYSFTDGDILYGPGLIGRARTNASVAQGMFAHELGHVGGLGDTDGSGPVVSIMEQISSPDGSCQNGTMRRTTASDSDASAVGGTGGCHEQALNSGGGVGGADMIAQPDYDTGCTAWYTVTETWRCVGGRCTLVSQTWTFISITC